MADTGLMVSTSDVAEWLERLAISIEKQRDTSPRSQVFTTNTADAHRAAAKILRERPEVISLTKVFRNPSDSGCWPAGMEQG